jgi:DNA-binding HxlR family transcriptional regulator
MKRKRYDCARGCPVEATLDLIDGKWKGVILYHLMDGPVRFNELGRRLGAITQRMLAKQLRELEEAGLITRTVHAQIPPRVDYALSAEGATLKPVIQALHDWGLKRIAAREAVPAPSLAAAELTPG